MAFTSVALALVTLSPRVESSNIGSLDAYQIIISNVAPQDANDPSKIMEVVKSTRSHRINNPTGPCVLRIKVRKIILHAAVQNASRRATM
jgi:hypothetical protein